MLSTRSGNLHMNCYSPVTCLKKKSYGIVTNPFCAFCRPFYKLLVFQWSVIILGRRVLFWLSRYARNHLRKTWIATVYSHYLFFNYISDRARILSVICFLFTSQGPPGASGNPGPPGRNGSTVRQQLSLTWSGMKILSLSTLHRRNLKMAFSLWKRIICFPSTLRHSNLKTHQSRVYHEVSPFLKVFSVHAKTKSWRFKFLRFEKLFRKAPFSWGISVDDRPSCRNKAEFFKTSPGVVWMSLNQRNALHQCFVSAAALLRQVSYPGEVWWNSMLFYLVYCYSWRGNELWGIALARDKLKVPISPKYFFCLNKSLQLFKMHCAFLPLLNPNIDLLQAVKVTKIWPSSVTRPSK